MGAAEGLGTAMPWLKATYSLADVFTCLPQEMEIPMRNGNQPWLVWLSGLSEA